MPTRVKRLSPEHIAELEPAIKIVALDPRIGKSEIGDPETIAAKARAHWAFQPLHLPPVPQIQNQRWVRTPVDAFILSRLEAKRLPPSPQADRRTRIRRATFDLIGLPPP